MSEFWRLLEESVIVQAAVTLLGMGLIVYMIGCGRAVPQDFWTIFGIIIGFWFGSKVQTSSRAARKDESTRMERVARMFNKGDPCE